MTVPIQPKIDDVVTVKYGERIRTGKVLRKHRLVEGAWVLQLETTSPNPVLLTVMDREILTINAIENNPS